VPWVKKKLNKVFNKALITLLLPPLQLTLSNPQFLFVLDGKEVGGLLVIILQF
jgi:hypothetical protein